MIKQKSKSKIIMNRSFCAEQKKKEAEQVKTLKKVLFHLKNNGINLFIGIKKPGRERRSNGNFEEY